MTEIKYTLKLAVKMPHPYVTIGVCVCVCVEVEVCQIEWNDKDQPKWTLHVDNITKGRAQDYTLLTHEAIGQAYVLSDFATSLGRSKRIMREWTITVEKFIVYFYFNLAPFFHCTCTNLYI